MNYWLYCPKCKRRHKTRRKMDLTTLQDFLSGKKTYLVALSALLAVVIGWADKSIPNDKAAEQAIGLIIAMTMRSGINSAVTNAARKEPTNIRGDGIEVRVSEK